MKKLSIIFMMCICTSAFAQKYTHADSLKGSDRPQRNDFNVTYYDLNLQVDIPNKFIKGWVGIYCTRVKNDVNQIQVDLYSNFKINSIQDEKGNNLNFKRDGNAIFVDFISKDPGLFLKVDYEGNPSVSKNAPWEPGFVFTKDKKGRPWVGVACQAVGSSIWWPSKDTQADEADSVKITVTTQSDLNVVANGNLRSEIKNGKLKTTTWFVSYPINNYDVSVNIGKYVNFNEKYKGVEATYNLDYYVLDYNLKKARKHFTQVVPMMNAFEKTLGPYPFPRDGYALVETPYLGMEHQSGIAYGNDYQIGYDGMERSGIDLKFDFIIIHETGHEWWGNSVGTKDVADMWVHEGFCTYAEALYVEELFGPDTALMYCNAWKNYIYNDKPIIGDYGVQNEGSGDMYNKGALMLHTLRWLVNDDPKWFNTIKGIQKDFRFQIVTSDQIIAYMNEKLEKDYTWFFDQYLKKAKPPVLKYELTSAGKDLQARIWFSNVSSQFKLPLFFKMGNSSWKQFEISGEPQIIIFENMEKSMFKVDTWHAYFIYE